MVRPSTLFAAAAGLAALAGINAAAARRAERRSPPLGRVLEMDGVRLHLTDRGASDRGAADRGASGGPPPVVILHGNGVSERDVAASGVAEALARTHRVVAFDRPGFGHSTRPRGRAWTAAQQAELLHRAMAVLDVRRPVLVGHSWGAIAALALALDHTRDVAGLVLVSGYYFPSPRLDVPLMASAATPVLGDLLRWTVSPLLGRLLARGLKRTIFAPAPVPPRFEREYPWEMTLRPSQLRAFAEDGAVLNRAVAAFPPARYGELAGMPVAILAGAGDRMVDRSQAERLHAAIPGSTLRIVAGAGHMLHHTAPQEVLDAVAAVAERYPAPIRHENE